MSAVHRAVCSSANKHPTEHAAAGKQAARVKAALESGDSSTANGTDRAAGGGRSQAASAARGEQRGKKSEEQRGGQRGGQLGAQRPPPGGAGLLPTAGLTGLGRRISSAVGQGFGAMSDAVTSPLSSVGAVASARAGSAGALAPVVPAPAGEGSGTYGVVAPLGCCLRADYDDDGAIQDPGGGCSAAATAAGAAVDTTAGPSLRAGDRPAWVAALATAGRR